MSASDKKQQRKAALADGLTQKQIKEQQEAQKAKRNRTIYAVIGVVCAIAVIALLVWNGMNNSTGRTNGNAVAATVDGTDYTVADLQYYYNSVKNNEYYYAQMYASYGISFGFDYTVDEGAQWYSESEGKTYADYFREEALEQLSQVQALCKAAKEAGFTLSDEGRAQVEDALSQIDVVCAKNGITRNSYFAQVYGNGVTDKVFTRNFTNDVLASEFATSHQEGLTYGDADLEAYYAEHKDTLDYYDYRTFYISGAAETTTDADGNAVEATDEQKEAAMAAAKEKADAAVHFIEISDDREAAFLEAAVEYADETAKEAYADSSYSLSRRIPGSNVSGASYGSWLTDSSRKAGDVTAVETTERYYVILFLDRYRVDENTADFRHILVMADTEGSTETDADGNAIPTAEAMEAARKTAQEILDEWKAGAATEDSFSALANDKSEDTGSNSNGGLYTYVYRGDMVQPVNDWIFDASRQEGDTGIVEYTGRYSGVHVLYYVGSHEPTWRETALSSLQSSAQSDWLEGIYASVTSEAKDGLSSVGSVNTATASSATAGGEG